MPPPPASHGILPIRALSILPLIPRIRRRVNMNTIWQINTARPPHHLQAVFDGPEHVAVHNEDTGFPCFPECPSFLFSRCGKETFSFRIRDLNQRTGHYPAV